MFTKFLLAITLASVQLIACGDFLIKATDQSVVNGRSMEFAIDLKTEISIHAKGEKFQSKAPNEKLGLAWTSKYGYLSLIGLGVDRPIDGMNEKGLSFNALWLSDSKYPIASEEQNALDLEDIGAWILGNFANVAELKKGLEKVQIWSHVNPQLGMVPPLHFAVHDAEGTSLVIEFLDGKMVVTDNPLGILTNSPSFDWHLSNLRNYVNLIPSNPKEIKSGAITIAPTGDGSGTRGLPGDWSSPSRFVKLFYMKHYAHTPKNSEQAVNLATHFLNALDIPYGVVMSNIGSYCGYCQWIVIKDLTNQKLYYRPYEEMNFRVLNLKEHLEKSSRIALSASTSSLL